MRPLPDDPYLSPAAPSPRRANLGFWDYLWKAFLVLVALIVGGIVALIIALSMGWIPLDFC